MTNIGEIGDKIIMGKEATMESIARGVGTSKSSIHCYFHPVKREAMGLDLKSRIREEIEKQGYQPNLHGPKKRKHKTHVLGLMVPFSSDIAESPYHSQLFAGILSGIQESSYDLKLMAVREGDYADIRSFFQRHLLDGLLILNWRIHPNLINFVSSASKPFPIILFNNYDKELKAHFVYCDVFAGMEMAVYHLIENGRKKIAFLKGPTYNHHGTEDHRVWTESLDTRDKFEGFKKGIKVSQAEIKDKWVKECSSYTRVEGYQKAKELLAQEELPDAVICSNDELAMGVLDALKEGKIRCPEDVAVIGFDGISEGESTNPPLTSIKQPLRQMGYEGGKRLIEIAEGKETGLYHIRFQPTLITRTSA